MKRQNLIIVVCVAVIATVLAVVVSNAVFGTPKSKPIKVPVVDKISSTFPDVHNDTNFTSFFNSNALDPTQLINIAPNNNTTPFQGGGQ